LEEIINRIIEKHPSEVQKFLKGKKSIISFFIGEVMKATNGKANPKVVNEILRKRLNNDRT
ncbi:MAG: Asp-tRNA(Asn)/Glu-tRNA(Gln) amidotransferase GatCAB subunit B, partial [Candidatus Neomarinimicrobiota bacterium]